MLWASESGMDEVDRSDIPMPSDRHCNYVGMAPIHIKGKVPEQVPKLRFIDVYLDI